MLKLVWERRGEQSRGRESGVLCVVGLALEPVELSRCVGSKYGATRGGEEAQVGAE